MNRSCAHHHAARGGFSLIETLIAVLVLGIGLLGLAAVFPVVISQQRDASDIILGGVASGAIRNQILANPDIAGEILSQDGYADSWEQDLDGDRVPNEPPGQDQPGDSNGDGVPDDFDASHVPGSFEPIFGRGENIGTNPERYNQRTGFAYLWEADWEWGDSALGADGRTPEDYLVDYRVDGGMRFRDPGERANAGLSDEPDLPVGARLYPPPFSIDGSKRDGPQFVWDFVPRRAPGDKVQFAVFVRRIDSGIRVPDGTTLSRLLTQNLADPDAVHAVAVSEADGLPTGDGSGVYSVPLSAVALPIPSDDYRGSAEYNAGTRVPVLLDGVRIDTSVTGDEEIATATAAQARLLAEVGQRFVDNLGVVREVVEVLNVEGDEIDLRVRPGFSINALFPDFAAVAGTNNEEVRESARTGKLRQVVFTPQAPVEVFVMEFNAR